MKCIAKMRRTANMKAKASTAKPWLKFYTEEALNAKLPKETLYEHVLKITNITAETLLSTILATR